MDAAQPPPPASSPPPPPAVLTAWPRSAQLAVAFLLGLVTALLAFHTYGYSRWGSRPTTLEPGARPLYHIDLNRADRTELLQLPGVGDSLAKRIEDHRREHGPFRCVDDLMLVHGIGPATLERLRGWVCVHREDAEDEGGPSPSLAKRATAPDRQPTGRKTGSKKEAGLAGLIDLNRATLEQLQRLPGVGPKMAQRIVDERRKAPFKTVDDLRRVPGIGPKTLGRLPPNQYVPPVPAEA
jgi:competence ComEA-like helix-hairpin-helix protein